MDVDLVTVGRHSCSLWYVTPAPGGERNAVASDVAVRY